MELFVMVLAIYLGLDAFAALVRTCFEPRDFPVAVALDIVVSIGLMVWAIVLLAD